MIERICMSKRVVDDLRNGQLAPYLDQFGELLVRSYDRSKARNILLCAGRFAAFAKARGHEPPQWSEELLADFLLEGDVTLADAYHAPNAHHLLADLGLFKSDIPPSFSVIRLLADFGDYLRDVRGLSEGRRFSQVDVVRQLLAFHRRRHGDALLSATDGKDILGLFQEASERYRCISTRQTFATNLRQGLRFLYLRGHIAQDLASTVPLFVNYRLSTVPAHLAWEDVTRLITSIDTTAAPGRRDRAILLLIAGLGLRPGSVRALTLDQIHWRDAEIRIPRTKNRRGINVPLTDEIGQALSDYVLHERPKTDSRTVFLRHTKPQVPFTSSSAITAMIYARLDRAGIARAKGAANLLRHSLATQLVNGGVPIKQVADVFGHASIDTTAIYTKVDLRSLRQVPMAFALEVTA